MGKTRAMLTVADTAYSIALVRGQEAELPEGERLFEDPYGAIFAAAGEHAREGTERFMALASARASGSGRASSTTPCARGSTPGSRRSC
jgi:hypothetical protein